MVIASAEEYQAAVARARALTDDPFRIVEEHEFQALLSAIEAWEIRMRDPSDRPGRAPLAGLDP